LSTRVAILTGGGDKPYALGLAAALTTEGILLDFIGSNELEVPELLENNRISFLNLRGDQRARATSVEKVARVIRYYIRLIKYAAGATPRLFHLLWNNKFEFFDRTLLMMYYRALGKRVMLTVHNVNAGKRDGTDSFLNRLTLRIQYGLSHHIFVHTRKMKEELVSEYGVSEARISIIPFGINNTVPNTALTVMEAKQRLGVNSDDKTLLFFGNIAPYKGLEYLVDAFRDLIKTDRRFRVIIAGRTKFDDSYWSEIERTIARNGLSDRVIARIEYIPDHQTEWYFKAADVLILPYSYVFQSGVLFLGYSFGLPVIVADVGTLREEVVEGRTGFVFKSRDSADLARIIVEYFDSDLFRGIATRREEITRYANDRYSWSKVAAITAQVYQDLLSK
jgi:glycosyltransferase involved in cell wall biosynthesis